VKTTGGTYKTRATLNELEQILSAHSFLRTHRSSLINSNYVLEIVPWFNGSYKLVMNDGEKTEIIVSRYHAKDLKRYFNL
jgi:DNA-binding LytR/AlgR family response regulator